MGLHLEDNTQNTHNFGSRFTHLNELKALS